MAVGNAGGARPPQRRSVALSTALLRRGSGQGPRARVETAPDCYPTGGIVEAALTHEVARGLEVVKASAASPT